MEIKKVGKIRFRDWNDGEYKEFLDRHEDLKLLNKADVTISGLKESFEERLQEALDSYIDPDEREHLEYVRDELKLASERLCKVKNMIREIHIREEYGSGRAEE